MIKNFYQNHIKNGSFTNKIIGINVLIFFTINILQLILDGSGSKLKIQSYFFAPSDLDLLINRPWTIVTYWFIHLDLLHLLSNMLLFYFAGNMYEQYRGEKALINTYFTGGIIGFLFFIIAYNIIPSFLTNYSVLFGASACCMAVLVALGTYLPNKKVKLFFLPNSQIQLSYIIIFIVLIDFLRLRTAFNTGDSSYAGGWIAHLGGICFGFLSVYIYRRNSKNYWFNFHVLVNRNSSSKTRRRTKNKYNKIETINVPKNDYDYNELKKNEEDIINSILDKIGEKGYESLSKKEREILAEYSSK